MSLKGSRLFLDTCVFFHCSEDEVTRKTLNHAVHSDNQLVTSITVLGEFVQECLPDRTGLIKPMTELLTELNVTIVRPDRRLRYCCLAIDKSIDDMGTYGVDFSDKTHLAYAMRSGCNYFVTSDRALRGIRDADLCSLFEDCNATMEEEPVCFPQLQVVTAGTLAALLCDR